MADTTKSPSGNRPPTFDVLGTDISAVKPQSVLRFVDATIQTNGQEYVCVCSTNNIMSARDDGELAKIHDEAGLCIPDGYPLAKLGQRCHPGKTERIRGTDLTRHLAKHAAENGYSLFLYGAAPGVPETMAKNLQDDHPRLIIAGTHSPPFRPTTPEEEEEEVDMISKADPDIILVGLPTPKQDRWMAERVDRVNANLLFGVGAAFDFIAGTKQQAPKWISQNGFEWAYRFAQEPTRLWRRVLIQGPRFAFLLAIDAIKRHVGRDQTESGGSP